MPLAFPLVAQTRGDDCQSEERRRRKQDGLPVERDEHEGNHDNHHGSDGRRGGGMTSLARRPRDGFRAMPWLGRYRRSGGGTRMPRRPDRLPSDPGDCEVERSRLSRTAPGIRVSTPDPTPIRALSISP